MDRLSSNGQMLSQIDLSNVPHSSFDRRNHNFLSCKLGKLVCTRLDEVYPGDRIKGHIEAVANFEPLVSPIMGSMVMKQESFYVPYSILWKNAHKFFTAKGGFDTPMPSVTPKQIFDAYDGGTFKVNSLLPPYSVSIFNQVYSSLLEDDTPAYDITHNIYELLFEGLSFHYYDSYGVFDLFSPIYNKLDHWFKNRFESEYDHETSRFAELVQNYIDSNYDGAYLKSIADALVDIYASIFEFYFGVSSHLDYMGFPVMDDWRSIFANGSRIGEDDSKNFFSIYELLTKNSGDQNENLGDLFSDIPLNWLPFRAAYVIWYWNYRDELLETSALDPESDTFLADTVTSTEIILLTLLRVRCWYKDAFTTALTNTGSANLSAPVTDLFSALDFTYYDSDGHALDNTKDFESAYQSGASAVSITTAGGLTYKIPMNYFANSFSVSGSRYASETSSYLSLDLFDRIHRLRTFLQKRLILGYEYDDMVWSSFMVKLSNVRMRIPELLARGRDVVQMNTVVNNTTTSEQIAGDKSAVAWAQGRTSDINYFCEEHGLFLSFLTIMPIQSYTGGMQRLYMKREQFDFMWPEFATMGMDAVYNFELSAPRSKYANYGLSDEAAMQVFGYQGRYYDLKSKMDECHGRMRTDLHFMTFSREFNMQELPQLNYQFVHCWPSLDMFVVDDDLVDVVRNVDVYNGLDFERRLPVPSEML